MANTYHMLSPSGEQNEVTVQGLMEIFTDWNSWLSFLDAALSGKIATMTAHMESGETHTYQVSRLPFESFA